MQIAPPVATPLQRLTAAVIDGWLVGSIAALLFFFLNGGDSLLGSEAPMRCVLAMLIASSSYHVFFLTTMSTTPGKFLNGLYVTDLNMKPLAPSRAALRYVAYLAGQMATIGYIVSGAFILKDPMRRAVHDRIAGTLVVVGRRVS
jgi:uncharacterized RDD family membrane protein YckC